MRALTSALTEIALSVFAPRGCAACDAPVRIRAAFCPACARTAVAAEDPTLAPFAFGGALAEAIKRTKYGARSDLGAVLGALLAGELARRATKYDLVVPVPLHPRRLAERGFNQSALIARPVAWALGATLHTRALERVRDTPPQAKLGRIERLGNMSGAFTARGDLRGKRVLVVDDVVTTGATLAACIGALAAHGAAEVGAVAVARA